MDPAIAEPAPEDRTEAVHCADAFAADAFVAEAFVQRLRNRDPLAFDQFVLEQGERVRRLVSRLLGWDNECDDVVQDVFVVAWESIEKFRGDSDPATWLYSIALNRCRKRRRDRGIRKVRFQKFWRHREPDESAGIQAGGGGDETNPQHPSIARIQAALNQLTQRDREAIVLCSLEGRTADEAARLMGIRKNALEVRLHRARKRLKKILDHRATLSDEEN